MRWTAIAMVILGVLGGAYGGYKYSRWELVEGKRLAATAAEKRVQERARQEAEARLAEVAAKKKADEERARQEGEARRLADAAAAEKRAAEERARQEAEAKRLADAAAKKKADQGRAAR